MGRAVLAIVPLPILIASTIVLLRLGAAEWPPTVAGIAFLILVWVPLALASVEVMHRVLTERTDA